MNILKEKDIIPLTYTPPLPTPLDTVEIEQVAILIKCKLILQCDMI